jgi:class 3 adenylate cyclase/AmiR/NasT family two-component response regulator
MAESNSLKILVIDDEPDLETLVRQKFRKRIRDGELQFFFAQNGQEALDQFENKLEVDIVLTDINMPVMDGLTLLNHLPDFNPIMKAIIVSAYGDMENIRIAMNRGAFDFVTKPVNFSDLEVTIDKTYKQVLIQKETLKAIRENDIYRMYVNEDVIRFMAGKNFEQTVLESEHIDATVAFMDICGYTAISERYPAEKVVTLLNRYFDIMVKEIAMEMGQVDKFMGDCVMAVFKGADHKTRALRASLAIRDKFESLTEPELDNFLPRIKIGVNSGAVVSGNIGSESLKRLDFTVIGDVVNTAQRLESIGQPGEILINESFYNDIKNDFNCIETKQVTLKNKVGVQRIFCVLNEIE